MQRGRKSGRHGAPILARQVSRLISLPCDEDNRFQSACKFASQPFWRDGGDHRFCLRKSKEFAPLDAPVRFVSFSQAVSQVIFAATPTRTF
jgi:hypothetical protein